MTHPCASEAKAKTFEPTQATAAERPYSIPKFFSPQAPPLFSRMCTVCEKKTKNTQKKHSCGYTFSYLEHVGVPERPPQKRHLVPHPLRERVNDVVLGRQPRPTRGERELVPCLRDSATRHHLPRCIRRIDETQQTPAKVRNRTERRPNRPPPDTPNRPAEAPPTFASVDICSRHERPWYVRALCASRSKPNSLLESSTPARAESWTGTGSGNGRGRADALSQSWRMCGSGKKSGVGRMFRILGR